MIDWKKLVKGDEKMKKTTKILIVTDGWAEWNQQDIVDIMHSYLSSNNMNPQIQIVSGTAGAMDAFKKNLDHDYLVFPQSLQSEMLSIISFLKNKAKMIIVQEEKVLDIEASHWVGPMLVLFCCEGKEGFYELMKNEPDPGNYIPA